MTDITGRRVGGTPPDRRKITIDVLNRIHGALDDWPEAKDVVGDVLDLLQGWCSPDLAQVVREAVG